MNRHVERLLKETYEGIQFCLLMLEELDQYGELEDAVDTIIDSVYVKLSKLESNVNGIMSELGVDSDEEGT